MPQIYLLDDLPHADTLTPEDKAMLQALYSRSDASVTQHLDRVGDDKGARFMERFYVGYGHDSIGDCAEITLFFEGVSILAAKAIQDTPLYRGQETSTRYLDFRTRAFRTHTATPDSEEFAAHLDIWRAVYTRVYTDMLEHLTQQHRNKHDIVASEPLDGATERALSAAAFDVARGFLPAGATTQLSWTTDIRHARDHLKRLAHHPLTEVRNLAQSTWLKLHERYPASFPARMWRENDPRDAYAQRIAQKFAYFVPTEPNEYPDFYTASTIDPDIVNQDLDELLRTRPAHAPLPYALAEYGHIQIAALLDYGSFRDLQRHRGGLCRLPLHTNFYGMHEWYILALPERTRQYVLKTVQLAEEHLAQLMTEHGLSVVGAQYYVPLAYRTPVLLQWDLRQLVYTLELRSAQTVHPTLRELMARLAQQVGQDIPAITTHVDLTPSTFSVKRGTQTITDKATGEAI